MRRARTIVIWILGISFIIIGGLKYVDLDEMTRPVFDRAQLPKWFVYAIGAVEFTAGFLVVMTANSPRRIGSILIAVVMIGAIYTRYQLHESLGHFMVPGAILLLAILMTFNVGSERKAK
jgi:hypothetical protein